MPDSQPEGWQLARPKANYGPPVPSVQLDWDASGGGLRWKVIGEWSEGAIRVQWPVRDIADRWITLDPDQQPEFSTDSTGASLAQQTAPRDVKHAYDRAHHPG